MKQTYDEAMTQVYADEGGYSNDAGDAGGPTKYGITIHDARQYWKSDATAADVRAMPKSVAADIYSKHYAQSIRYDDLPPGIDYAVLDYGINSGVSRALKVYSKVKSSDDKATINAIYDERVAFLRRLGQRMPQFLNGWLSRCRRGRKLALDLNTKYSKTTSKAEPAAASTVIVGGTAAAIAYPHLWVYILIGTAVAAIGGWFLVKYLKGNK